MNESEAILHAILQECRIAPNGLAASLQFVPQAGMDFRSGFSVFEPGIEVQLGPKADFGPELRLTILIYCQTKLARLEAALIASIGGRYSHLRPDEPLFTCDLNDPKCLDRFAKAISGFGVEFTPPP
jgi:hypothetical protein